MATIIALIVFTLLVLIVLYVVIKQRGQGGRYQ